MPNYNQNYNRWEPEYSMGAQLTLNQYMTRAFTWMFIGLLTTFGLAFAIAWTGLYVPIMRSGAVFAITIAEFILVIALSSRVQHMAPATATLLFFLYAVMNGVMFSVYFIAYNLPMLIGAFLVAAIYFGVMAAYGAITKKDLSSWGAIGLSGLIALLIFEIICMFLNIEIGRAHV